MPPYSDFSTPGDIGQDGDTVHIEMELYNREMRIAVGDEVYAVRWDNFCEDPARNFEARVLSGVSNYGIADVEVYNYTYETDITGFTLTNLER